MRAELREDSVAAIVLDSAAGLADKRASALRRPIDEGGLAAIVLGPRATRRGPVGVALLILAFSVHAVAALATLASRSKDPSAPKAAATPPIQIDHVVELDPPEPPPPPAEEPPPVARTIERAPTREPAPPEPPSEGAPPPPAEAAEVVAAADDASEALDFTGFDIATGDGPRYAGGITASSGTSTRAVRGPVVDRAADPNARAGTSRARPVGAPRREWDCPWPVEAEALSIDEQLVVIRAVVRADGTVASAELMSDPGHGFGAVALACVREQRFPAAMDDEGRSIAATSPPIRVRFTRP